MTLISQNLYSYVYQTSGFTQSDIALDEVELDTPVNNATLCRLDGDTVTLIWNNVDLADKYVVQFCQSSQFQGPTLDSRLVTDSGGATTSLALTVGTDIFYLGQYFWRVMPYSDTGGSGPKSEIRQFNIACKQHSQDIDGDCSDANVSISIEAPQYFYCAQSTYVFASISFDSTNYTFVSGVWSVSGPASIPVQSSTDCYVSVEQCHGDEVEVTYTLTLSIGTVTVQCQESVKVPIECNFLDSRNIIATPYGTALTNQDYYLYGGYFYLTQYEYVPACGEYKDIYYHYNFVQWPRMYGGVFMEYTDGYHYLSIEYDRVYEQDIYSNYGFNLYAANYTLYMGWYEELVKLYFNRWYICCAVFYSGFNHKITSLAGEDC